MTMVFLMVFIRFCYWKNQRLHCWLHCWLHWIWMSKSTILCAASLTWCSNQQSNHWFFKTVIRGVAQKAGNKTPFEIRTFLLHPVQWSKFDNFPKSFCPLFAKLLENVHAKLTFKFRAINGAIIIAIIGSLFCLFADKRGCVAYNTV